MERALIRQEISKACKRLALTQQVVTMCELEATPRQEEFLYQVLSQELAYRERLRRERLLKRAAFPVRKTLDDYFLWTLCFRRPDGGRWQRNPGRWTSGSGLCFV